MSTEPAATSPQIAEHAPPIMDQKRVTLLEQQVQLLQQLVQLQRPKNAAGGALLGFLVVVAGLIAAMICIVGGLSLLEIRPAQENSLFGPLAHGLGLYCIGKGIYCGADLLFRKR